MALGDVLLVVELLDGRRLGSVRQPQEEPGHGEGHVARVLALAERPPFRVLRALEDRLQVLQVRKVREVGQPEESGPRRRDERRVGHRGDARHVLQELDVLGSRSEIVVRDHRPVRLSAELPELRGVGDLVKAGLHDLGGVLEVLEEILLAHVQELDLDVLPEIGLVDEVFHGAPRRLEILELRRVHDRVDLEGELLVDFRDHLVEDGARDLRDLLPRLEDLMKERLDTPAGDRVRLVLRADLRRLDDLVEERRPFDHLRLCLPALFLFCRHRWPPIPRSRLL